MFYALVYPGSATFILFLNKITFENKIAYLRWFNIYILRRIFFPKTKYHELSSDSIPRIGNGYNVPMYSTLYILYKFIYFPLSYIKERGQ